MNKNRISKIAKLYKLAYEPSGILQTSPGVTTYSTRLEALEDKKLKAPLESEKYPDTMKEHPNIDVKKTKSITPSSLSTRYAPGFIGLQAMRVSDDEVANPLTGKIYNYKEGFEAEGGKIYPGGSVSLQTKV